MKTGKIVGISIASVVLLFLVIGFSIPDNSEEAKSGDVEIIATDDMDDTPESTLRERQLYDILVAEENLQFAMYEIWVYDLKLTKALIDVEELCAEVEELRAENNALKLELQSSHNDIVEIMRAPICID